MSMLFYYKAFGLTFSSDIVLPQLPLVDKPASVDIIIARSIGVKNVLQNERQFLNHQYLEQELFLHIPDVSDYQIKSGRQIEYNPHKNSSMNLVALMITNTCISHVLQQRGLLVLNGMAIVHNKQTYLFVSNDPSGKSFLAAALAKQGYKVLSDELCVLNAQRMVLPGYDRLKIWQNCMRYLKTDYTQLAQIRTEINKFYYPLADAFEDKPHKLAKIVCYQQYNQPECRYQLLTGVQKFMILKNHIATLPLLETSEFIGNQIEQVLQLATNVPVVNFERAAQGLKVKQLIELLEQHVFNDEKVI